MNEKNLVTNRKRAHLNNGKIAEDKAGLYLQQQGLVIINRNFHSRYGEIDIILLQHAKHLFKETVLIFCEVRSRKNTGYGSALESIDIHKQNKLRKTADYFMLKNSQYAKLKARFDVIIVPTASQQNEAIHWLENAF